MIFFVLLAAAFGVFMAVYRFRHHGIAFSGSLLSIAWLFDAGIAVAAIFSMVGIILVVHHLKGVVL